VGSSRLLFRAVLAGLLGGLVVVTILNNLGPANRGHTSLPRHGVVRTKVFVNWVERGNRTNLTHLVSREIWTLATAHPDAVVACVDLLVAKEDLLDRFGNPLSKDVRLLEAVAMQLDEVRRYSTAEAYVNDHELEAASRHKSEFLANMSHELRTLLNAILGFSEVLAERMFEEVNEKQAEYLQDILASGRHLLSLINDILDLSKVEAGRLELELGRFHLPTALENALTLVRERATRHGITLTQTGVRKPRSPSQIRSEWQPSGNHSPVEVATSTHLPRGRRPFFLHPLAISVR
jgi:signal transduction histidine kinase